jgi:5-formyltetrahydrofolate cyclo-ligase
MNKEELRRFFLAKRKQLSSDEYARLNLQLYHLFFTHVDLSFLKVLHTYLPIQRNNEPDTWQLLDRVRREFPHIRISLPKMTADGRLENFFFEGIHQLVKNSLGISEPRQGVPTPTGQIDLVIVPLLAFDQSGHRIGYGKGYYDRFLTECRNDCQKIGLSLFGPVESIDDAGIHDVKLNMVIEPGGVHHY